MPPEKNPWENVWFGLCTPSEPKPPKTVSELLDRRVRGPLRKQMRPFRLKDREHSKVLYTKKSGEVIMDNGAEMSVCEWVNINAKKRGVKAIYPRKKHSGD